MDITFQIMVLLTVVAAVAGFVDAMAGGGGLLTIPAMLMANIPPLLTLGTNNTKPNNYSIVHFRAVRDLMVSTCLAKLHQA